MTEHQWLCTHGVDVLERYFKEDVPEDDSEDAVRPRELDPKSPEGQAKLSKRIGEIYALVGKTDLPYYFSNPNFKQGCIPEASDLPDMKPKKGKKEAFKWYMRAAELGDMQANLAIGDFYGKGYAREQDDELAQSWLKRVATMNDTSAHAWTDGVPYHILGKFKLGQLLCTINEDDKGIEWIKQTHPVLPEASYLMGMIYLKGGGRGLVPQDGQKAVYWFKEAVKLKYYKALTTLGHMYMQGRAVPKDEARGIKILKISADKGCKEAEAFADQLVSKLKDGWRPDVSTIQEIQEAVQSVTSEYGGYWNEDALDEL